jgi:hypothetical protein
MHMCYCVHMATVTKSNRTSTRTVVLLRESAKKKLERLATKEKVSSGEIIRRSLDSYETIEARIRKEQEEKMMEVTLKLVIEALESANASMVKTCNRLDELHLELSERAIP